MELNREVLLTGPASILARQTSCRAPVMPQVARETEAHFGRVIPLVSCSRRGDLRLAAQSRALDSWETAIYVALFACGLLGIGLCLV